MKTNSITQHRRVEPLLRWLRETPKDEAKRRCAERGTSIGYLRQIAYGYKQAGLNGAEIEAITGNAVTRRDLRPDDWERIWPELAGKVEPPKGPAEVDYV
ncbi:hypothetical protein [Paracandidimonas soli]|uniref:hypothetical protein n=1 Tax=Paracandidimonas soli TaxID=1917182 RepID=UPI0010458F10|nr:hypothetical protein [Paracandidimonas soli]